MNLSIQSCRGHLAYAYGYAALVVGSLIPVWMVVVPPLGDYPNHLARMHILLNASSSAVLSQFYEVHWSVIPNLAMDLIVPPIARLVPLEVAGKIFVTLTLALLSSGALALHYALHRRFSAWPFATFLLLYNGVFLYGVLNFLFGLGLVFWALAAWIHWPTPRAARKLLFFEVVCLLLFFAHLAALGIFVLTTLVYEVVLDRRQGGHIGVSQAGWLAALASGPVLLVLLFVMSTPSGSAAEPPFQYGTPSSAAAMKLWAMWLLFANYNNPLDLGTLGLMVCIVVYSGLTGRLSVHPTLRWPLTAVGLAFVAMPFQVFGSNFADSRILVAAAFLFVSAASVQTSVALGRGLALSLLILFGARMAMLLDNWRQSDIVQAQYMVAIDRMPEGARLVTVWSVDVPDVFNRPPIALLAPLAVMRKSVFLPSLYAMPRGQPITFTPAYRKLAAQAREFQYLIGESPVWADIIAQYDYVLVIRGRRGAPPPPELSLVYQGTDFRLYSTPRVRDGSTLTFAGPEHKGSRTLRSFISLE